MSTIPANLFVAVTPSVLAVGGSALDMITLMLTTSTRVPIGTVMSFPDDDSVGAYFGLNSDEAAKAAVYFAGFDNAQVLPGSVLFAQYNEAAVAAYLRGGNAGAALTLAQLQALSGSLNVVIDGYAHAISSINLASYSSFSAAAAAIQAAFTDPTESTFTGSLGASFTASGSGTNLTTTAVTGLISVGDTVAGTGIPASTTIVSQTSGTPGGAGVYVTSGATTASSASCTAASTVLNVTAETGDDIAVGQTLVGSGITGSPTITALITGTGGEGTYRISGAQQTVASEAMTGQATAPLVTFDSVSGAFVITSGITGAPSTAAFATGTLAAPLLLTAATGAVLSQGAAAAVPASFMNGVVAQTTDWANFMTLFDPDGGSGNTVKQAFAAWKNTQNDRFGYICWDPDVTPAATLPATGSLGYILTQNGDSGTELISAPDATLAAFAGGTAASIAYGRPNGRTTLAFRNQAGLAASVTTAAAAVNLGGNPQVVGSFGNGYNYYGAVGAANASFQWFQRGTVTGRFRWFDSFLNQVWWNSLLQASLLTFLGAMRSIPFNAAGAGLIDQALADPIQTGLSFGAAAPGTISSAQIAEVNAEAGADIAGTLQTQGYYLQVLQQSSAVRASRGPWLITLWYLDRGSVQSISLNSVAVQ